MADSSRSALSSRLETAWLRFLPHLTRDYLWVTVDGFRLFGSVAHQKILNQLLKGSYERVTRQLFREAVGPGMHVLDIGAHVGYYTLVAAREAGTQGRVHAFECDPRSYRFLCHNVKINVPRANVVTVPRAVAGRPGTRAFFLHGEAGGSSLWSRRGDETSIEVEATTVDDILGGEAAHVIKMDIEGAELGALEGMERTLASSPSPVLFVECNPRALAAAGGSSRALLERLAALGFRVQIIDESRRALRPVNDELFVVELQENRKYYVNLYCVKE